jgi:hypothetical protein
VLLALPRGAPLQVFDAVHWSAPCVPPASAAAAAPPRLAGAGAERGVGGAGARTETRARRRRRRCGPQGSPSGMCPTCSAPQRPATPPARRPVRCVAPGRALKSSLSLSLSLSLALSLSGSLALSLRRAGRRRWEAPELDVDEATDLMRLARRLARAPPPAAEGAPRVATLLASPAFAEALALAGRAEEPAR